MYYRVEGSATRYETREEAERIAAIWKRPVVEMPEYTDEYREPSDSGIGNGDDNERP